MAATVESLRRYLRLPPDGMEGAAGPGYAGISQTPGDDSLNQELTAYLNAAVAFCANAGVPWRDADPLYDLLILKLAAQEYDNRGLGFAGSDTRSSEETRQRMLNSFMLNLRYAAAEQEAP